MSTEVRVPVGTLNVGDCFEFEDRAFCVLERARNTSSTLLVVEHDGDEYRHPRSLEVIPRSAQWWIERGGPLDLLRREDGKVLCPACKGVGIQGTAKKVSRNADGIRVFNTDIEDCPTCEALGYVFPEVAERYNLQEVVDFEGDDS
jgi:hypothetical protein